MGVTLEGKGPSSNGKSNGKSKRKTRRKGKLGLMNWWPGRGPLPKRFRTPKQVLPAPTVKDIEIARPMMASFEKASIEAMVTGDQKMLKKLNALPPKAKRKGRKSKKVVLTKARPRYYNDFFLNHHVESVASIPFETARRLIVGGSKQDKHLIAVEIEPKPITIMLDYPLSKAVEVTIKPYKRYGQEYMDLGYVLWQVAQQYKRIYKQHKRYGVWGHMLDDLWFERLTIKDGRGELFIGS